MSRTETSIALGVLMLAAAAKAGAAPAEPDRVAQFRVPLLTEAPVVDGSMAHGEWDNAVGFDGMTWRGSQEDRAVRGYVTATATDFYFAIESELPADDGKLLAKVNKNIAKLVHDDAFEVWIDTNPGAARSQLFQVLGNATGHQAYLMHARGGGRDVPNWDGAYQIAHGITDDVWVTEVRVPVASITPGRATADGAWGIALCRDWKQPWKFSSAPGDFRGSNTQFVVSDSDALAVQYRNVTDPFTRDIHGRLTMRNPGHAPVTVTACIELERNTMPLISRQAELTIAPGATEMFEFRHTEDNSDMFGLSVRVRSRNGNATYYDRFLRWGKPRRKRWDTTRLVTRPIDFQFAHYPYRRQLRIKSNHSGLKAGATLESLTFTVRKQGTTDSVASAVFDAFGPDKTCERVIELPPLAGVYEIVMTAAGNGVPVEPLVKTFVRKRYEWEGNTLGKSTKVYSPFTPIEVRGKTLKTVLREHTLNDVGLWDAVSAKGTQLLARPMVFRATVQGTDPRVWAAPLRFTDVKPNVVTTASRFATGAFKAVGRGTWDYDGTLKVELELQPTEGSVVDALTLEIPVRNSIAPMLHAMKEGIRRGPVSITLPEGEGTIWNSNDLPEGDMPNGFCSYVFVGSALRGLCWFAENDLNWGWEHGTPAVELVRQDDVLTVRVNLINRPTVIETPRRITFGLLAAPVKPRPEAWRTFWLDNRCKLLGTCINWLGGPGSASNIYPPGKDLYFWEMIARGNVEKVPRADIEACKARGDRYFAPYDKIEAWRRHVQHNVGGARFETWMVFYYNRATFSACEEYATFMNEWGLADYPAHDFKPSIGEIKLVPSESYNDFALHWYAKSFEVGRNKGVYWDNWFIKPSFNRVLTDAYECDGEIVPAAGIWGMRELCRRTFVMMNERGMVPITMPHMTSTNILPMHSFATVQYDWEWKYSTGDVQYRHSREYLQLVSNGELAGLIPVPLHEHGKQARDEWTQRTFCGVALVHELISGGHGKAWKTLRDPIWKMSHAPDLKVWRYWDEGTLPAAFGNEDLPVITYAVPGKQARIVLCSYAAADIAGATLRFDPAAFGMSGPVKVTNYETGQVYAVENNAVTLNVKKHEVIGFLVTPQAGE